MKKIWKWGLICILSVFAILVWRSQYSKPKLEDTIFFRLAEVHPSDYPTTLGDKEFARLVEEKTNGRIVIKVFDSQQLGTEMSVLEQIQFGAIDFARVSLAPLAEFEPKLNVLQLPYIYRSDEHMWQVLNSEIGEYFLESIKDEGFIGLGWYDGGARNFYNSIREIDSIEDFKGLKLRIIDNDLILDMARALGATAIPMPYGEVYSAIQTGSIDGAENNFPSYDTSSHYKVAKYYTIDEHVRIPEVLVASNKVLDRISEDDLEIIKQCAKDSQMYQRSLWKKKEKESKEKVKEEGTIITEVEDKESFIKAVTPLYDKYAKDQMDIVKQIQEMGE